MWMYVESLGRDLWGFMNVEFVCDGINSSVVFFDGDILVQVVGINGSLMGFWSEVSG